MDGSFVDIRILILIVATTNESKGQLHAWKLGMRLDNLEAFALILLDNM